jgi:hypothetical protein
MDAGGSRFPTISENGLLIGPKNIHALLNDVSSKTKKRSRLEIFE